MTPPVKGRNVTGTRTATGKAGHFVMSANRKARATRGYTPLLGINIYLGRHEIALRLMSSRGTSHRDPFHLVVLDGRFKLCRGHNALAGRTLRF